MSRGKRDRRKLTARWSKRDKDLIFYYPSGPDGHFLHAALNHTRVSESCAESIVAELEKRGYDIETLRFEIRLKDQPSSDQ